MLKLLLCILAALALGVILLQLRQQRLELSYQTNRLHGLIEHSQAKLWNQQLQIAVYTAPNAISKTVGERDLNMVPQTPSPAIKTNWLDARTRADDDLGAE
jgi:cell division protein FtsL